MKSIRDLLSVVESVMAERVTDNPEISYTDEPTKVTATVSGRMSEKYTKLAQKLDEMERLAAEIKALQEETKQSRRDDIAALFSEEDAVLTRVIDTKSVIFTLSKDPKATESVKYAKVLEDLTTHLTPALIEVMEALKKTHTSVVQKEPSLKYHMKELEEAMKGTDDSSKIMKLVGQVERFLGRYDAALDDVKMDIESMDSDPMAESLKKN